MILNNLENVMIGVTEVRKELPEIINTKQTKVIIKNNVPVSVVMPYEEYVTLNEGKEEAKNRMVRMGQNIRMNNDTQVLVVAGVGGNFDKDDLCIKVMVKMMNSDEYKLLHTFNMGQPHIDQTMTNEELSKYYEKNQ